MVWGDIGLNEKLGPDIFQNLGPGRGSGVKTAFVREDDVTSLLVNVKFVAAMPIEDVLVGVGS
jgi:hypothetical protein